MARHRWRDPVGRATIQRIIKAKIPDWKDGLHIWQLDIVCRVLDLEDILCTTATGDGKSALLGAPMVVLLEMASNPFMYPDLPYRKNPVGIVITPTKGLAGNIVYELDKLGVREFSYTSDTVTEARKQGRKIQLEIAECKWPIICVDPEHLTGKEWKIITDAAAFRENLGFACIDEVHLVDEWGVEFRPAFKHVGPFIRGCLPSSISVLALSATLQPGKDTNSICSSLGFTLGSFHHERRSNERPNIQFIFESFPMVLAVPSFRTSSVISLATVK